jgi:hypothetical protein
MPRRSNPVSHDVFVSYSSQDFRIVQAVVKWLSNKGVRVWFDRTSIQAGDTITAAIEQGLTHSNTCLAMLSKQSIRSDWAKMERATVVFRDPTNRQRRFIPVLLDDCTLPDTLRIYRYVDLRRRSAKAYRELLTAIGHENACAPRVLCRSRPKISTGAIIIHHIEDEPELVRWIPAVLHHRFFSMGAAGTENEYCESAEQVVFGLIRQGVESQIVYRWHRSVHDFEMSLLRSRHARQIVIADMMIESDGGAFANWGWQALRLVVPYVHRDRRFILSAYPRAITGPVRRLVDPSNVFFKGDDPDKLISRLVRHISQWL